MDSDLLVRHLDPLKDCRTRLVVRSDVLSVHDFLLQRRPEAFQHGVAVAVAGTAYALRGHRANLSQSSHAAFQMHNQLVLPLHAPNTHGT